MDTEKALKTLVKIATKQQNIIKKLAQEQLLQNQLNPQEFAHKPEVQSIMKYMDSLTRDAVQRIEVTVDNIVQVKFHPGKGTDAAWAGVQNAVQKAQEANELPATSYQVVEVV